MTLFQEIKSQLDCMWVSTYSQADSLWKGTRNTVSGVLDSTEFYTDLTARYIFAIDRSSKNRNAVFENFVVPLLSLEAALFFCFGAKAALCLATATTIYTLVIAKKNGYF